MAIALPPDQATKPATTIEPAVAEWRLPDGHARDLRDVARGLEESDVGIRTRYLEEPNADVRDPDADARMFDLEAFCNRFGIIGPWANKWRTRVRRCRAALRRLSIAGDHDAVGALHVFYGYPDPSIRSWPTFAREALGDLAPLLRYTDATEEVRRRLVREALLRPAGDPVWTAFACRRAGGEPAALWRSIRKGGGAVEVHKAARAASPLPPAQGLRPLALVVSLSDVRERERFLDRAIGSGDAVREALAPFPEALAPRAPGEAPHQLASRVESYRARSSAHGERRRAYLEAGRRDAAAMLTRASRAYHACWLVASGD